MNKQILTLLLLVPVFSFAQKKSVAPAEAVKTKAITGIESNYAQYKAMAHSIWNFAEVGYKEEKSSALLQEALTANGFVLEKGVAGIPTAFIASFGSGQPVIGILAEFDA